MPEGVHQLKAFAQFPGKACRIVPVDGQSAAFFRTVEGKGPDDDMAAGPDRLSQTRHVGGAVRWICLLYTSDAADERSSVDLGGRRIIKKKKDRI